jgi:hypothetical protein
MFKLGSMALCCAMCGAALTGTAGEAEAKKGSFTRAVGIGVGVGIAKHIVKKDRHGDGDHDTAASAVSSPAAGMMIATPAANTGPAKPQPPAAQPSEPVGDGKIVCVAGCY